MIQGAQEPLHPSIISQSYKPLLCLNMIVKDESAIIRGTLEKLVKNAPIDYWVICDTGSTDGTQDIITSFFKEKGIPGELYQDEWKNFGFNRTKALQYAFNKSKYLLVFDADDALNMPLDMPQEDDMADGYLIRLLKGLNEYERVLMIRNNREWMFRGVVHEIIQCVNHSPVINKLNTTVHVSTSGARNNDPKKYEKDADMLEKAYYEAKEQGDNISDRYAFYCANSYLWCSNNDKAEEWYKRVLELGNWSQEKYMACYELGNIYRSRNEIEKAMYYYIKSNKYDNTRFECIHKVIEHFVIQDDCNLAYNFYRLIQDRYEKEFANPRIFDNKLFVDTSIYSLYLPYIMIIASNRTGNHSTALKMFEALFTLKSPIISMFHIDNMLYNLTLYTDTINKDTKMLELLKGYVEFLKKYNVNLSGMNHYERLKKINIEW